MDPNNNDPTNSTPNSGNLSPDPSSTPAPSLTGQDTAGAPSWAMPQVNPDPSQMGASSPWGQPASASPTPTGTADGNFPLAAEAVPSTLDPTAAPAWSAGDLTSNPPAPVEPPSTSDAMPSPPINNPVVAPLPSMDVPQSTPDTFSQFGVPPPVFGSNLAEPASTASGSTPTWMPQQDTTSSINPGSVPPPLLQSSPFGSSLPTGTTQSSSAGFEPTSPFAPATADLGMGSLGSNPSPAPDVTNIGSDSPTNSSENNPTDLSHLVDSPEVSAPSPTSGSVQPQTLVVPAPAEASQVVGNGSGGFPKWVIIIGGLLILLAVGGASAYFILGVGKPQPQSEPLIEEVITTAQPQVTSIPQPTFPVASPSASFNNLDGRLTLTPTVASSSGDTGSAIDRLRQRAR